MLILGKIALNERNLRKIHAIHLQNSRKYGMFLLHYSDDDSIAILQDLILDNTFPAADG